VFPRIIEEGALVMIDDRHEPLDVPKSEELSKIEGTE
jgi:hypothetical protein